MKKDNPMKSRGVRFPDQTWDKLEKEAAKDKEKRIKPSDVVRVAVDEYFERREKKK